MRRVVESKCRGEEEIDEITAEKIFGSRKLADQMVYQLVRIEDDGRLVPATNDEVIEVDHLLADEKVKIPLELCDPIEVLSCNKSVVECSEGLSHSEITEDDSRKLNARLQYIEGMLQQVNQEERLRLSCDSLHLPSKLINVDDQSSDHLYQSLACNDDFQLGNTSQETDLTGVSGSHIAQLKTKETCMKSGSDPVINGSSVFEPSTKPDFKVINSEISLDNLTVRELQEVLQVSFRQQTNVKDKTWLKRRITMELTNSLENQATKSVIKEDLSYSAQNIEFKLGSPDTNQLIWRDSATTTTNEIEDQRVSCCKRLRKPFLESDAHNENILMEQSVVKRVRKPNSRRIADRLEVETDECTGKFSFLRSCQTTHFRSVRNILSQDTMHLTRKDSLGGSIIQIPYAYRVRRRRPRKDFVALANHYPSGMGAKLVKTIDTRVAHQGGDSGSMMLEPKSIQLQSAQRNTGNVVDQEKRAVEKPDLEDEHNNDLEHEKACPSRENSDEGTDISSSMRCGTKRNHHRVWSLNEVVKLVEGVEKCGFGQWSKIKRLVFASYTHRTSVDLKDKWRNLLRASRAQQLDNNRSRNNQKHASTSVPEHILLRVKELAERHSCGR